MFKRLMIRVLILAAAIAVTAWLVPDINVTGGFATYLWIACIFGLVNGLLGPILRLVSLPITLMTLGLFALVINAVLLAITAGLSSHLSIDGFLTAVLGALCIAIFSGVLNRVVRA